MKFRVLILLFLFGVPIVAQAGSDPGCKNKQKDKQKAETTQAKQPNIHSVEQFAFMIPEATTSNCAEHQAFRSTVVNYYRWYLENENRITDGLSRENKGKDLIPPFNISWETLHEYFEFIQKKYAGWLPSDAAPQSYDAGTASLNNDKEVPVADTLASGSNFNLSNLAK